MIGDFLPNLIRLRRDFCRPCPHCGRKEMREALIRALRASRDQTNAVLAHNRIVPTPVKSVPKPR